MIFLSTIIDSADTESAKARFSEESDASLTLGELDSSSEASYGILNYFIRKMWNYSCHIIYKHMLPPIRIICYFAKWQLTSPYRDLVTADLRNGLRIALLHPYNKSLDIKSILQTSIIFSQPPREDYITNSMIIELSLLLCRGSIEDFTNWTCDHVARSHKISPFSWLVGWLSKDFWHGSSDP